jgi:hypothetical protein
MNSLFLFKNMFRNIRVKNLKSGNYTYFAGDLPKILLKYQYEHQK